MGTEGHLGARTRGKRMQSATFRSPKPVAGSRLISSSFAPRLKIVVSPFEFGPSPFHVCRCRGRLAPASGKRSPPTSAMPSSGTSIASASRLSGSSSCLTTARGCRRLFTSIGPRSPLVVGRRTLTRVGPISGGGQMLRVWPSRGPMTAIPAPSGSWRASEPTPLSGSGDLSRRASRR